MEGGGSRFHLAARDSFLDLLRQGNKRELNSPDEDGMTPVHWAAFHGHLEALRIIVGRGGDVDKSDVWGNSAIHYAARRNHLNCLSFLVNFGANIWALDNDGHSALDVAGLAGFAHLVRYLDSERSRQASLNPKEAARKKQKALADAEKRLKKWQRLTDRHQRRMTAKSPVTDPHGQASNAAGPKPTTVRSLTALNSKLKATLRIGGGSKSLSKVPESRLISHFAGGGGAKGTTTTGEDGQVIYAQASSATDSGISLDLSPEPPSLFERPGFGSVAFRSAVSSKLFQDLEAAGPSTIAEDSAASSHSEDEAAKEGRSPLELWLEAGGLGDWFWALDKEAVTLQSLPLLSDEELAEMGLPLGPRKLLRKALAERQRTLDNPGQVIDVKF